jgi:hypothetical protein
MTEIIQVTEELKLIRETLSSIQRSPKEILTYEEGMNLLDCSRKTMDTYRKEGMFPVYSFKGKLYVKYSEILAALEANVEGRGVMI